MAAILNSKTQEWVNGIDFVGSFEATVTSFLTFLQG